MQLQETPPLLVNDYYAITRNPTFTCIRKFRYLLKVCPAVVPQADVHSFFNDFITLAQ